MTSTRPSAERQTPFGTLSLDSDELYVRPVSDGEFRIFSGRIIRETGKLGLRKISEERYEAERARIEDLISWAHVEPDVTTHLEALRTRAENAVRTVTGLDAWSSSWSWTQGASAYKPATGQVFICRYFEGEPMHARARRQHSAYHECAHAASAKGVRTVIIMEDGTDPQSFEQVGLEKGRFTGNVSEPFVVEGEFFSEAFAEETAMRCRQNDAPSQDREATHLGFLGHDVWLSNEYIYRTMDGKPYLIGTAAMAAHTLSRLSELSGKDLYQLMIDANEPEKRAKLQREIICAIESVEKGLYKKLRQAEYTPDSFAEIWRYVDEIIAVKGQETAEVV